MTAPKANPQRAGRKPGPRIPCGGCFQRLTAREWKGHFAHCTGREHPRIHMLLGLSPEWVVLTQKQKFAVFVGGRGRIGPWRETPIEAVRDCPLPKGKAASTATRCASA